MVAIAVNNHEKDLLLLISSFTVIDSKSNILKFYGKSVFELIKTVETVSISQQFQDSREGYIYINYIKWQMLWSAQSFGFWSKNIF